MNKDNVKYFQVAQGVWGMKIVFVNIYMIANRKGSAKGWVLVDAGLKGSAAKIIAMAESIFGPGTKPSAIVLTHGHFDHVGALEELLKVWHVPVYAHSLELPYLTGLSSYPPPDPTVGGGMMALLSFLYPTSPIDLGDKVKAIDMIGGIPELPEWKFIHTPGHSPGHISMFLPSNATLVAGDAFSTTKAESAIYVLNFIKKLSGPPKYFTTDWELAADSVRRLAALKPRMAAVGHGYVMRGKELEQELNKLAKHFKELAVPGSGRYVDEPASADQSGTRYVPPFVTSTRFKMGLAVVTALLGFALTRTLQKKLI